MSDPRDADDQATASATPPQGSGDLPRLGPVSGSGKAWVREDSTNQTGWVQGEKTAEWVKKAKSGEGWVDTPAARPDDLGSQKTARFEEEATAVEAMATPTGARRRLGDFELERKVGQGGMGEVWLARQISLDRPVAVKILPRSLSNQENFIERFKREAQAAASLVHPNVLQIYSFGVSDGTPYFAMEYVEGEDLQQRMRRERLDWPEIARIMIGIGAALASAHEKGLIHRDIKPSNVMIDKNGLVKVMDFGLAKATTTAKANQLTSAGLIMGTPNYLSPEQGRGDPLDGRSDLYSLGVVLYELITGQLPFRADTPAGLIFKHVYEPPPPPVELNPDAPPFLVEIALKLLEKDPDDRYKSAIELVADMSEFLQNQEHYLTGGARRPGAGSEDPELAKKGSGRLEAVVASVAAPSSAQRRRPPSDRVPPNGAVTEEITKPSRVESNDVKAIHAVSPRATSQRRAAALEPPPRRSRLPLALLTLALLGAGGYALWLERPDLVREWAGKVGLQLPAPTTELERVPPPSGAPVAYALPPGALPAGVTAALEVPGHRFDLRPNEEGRYQPGAYTLELTRTGYQPAKYAVQLVKGDDGRGVLLDSSGRDAVRVTPRWEPVPELREAYDAGRSALTQGDLAAAKVALEKATRLDREFRPSEEEPTAGELLEQTTTRLSESERTTTRIEERLALAREHMDARRWRAARDLLTALLATLPEGQLRADATSRLAQCESNAQLGDTLRAAVETEITRGGHDAAEAKLGELRAADADNPQLAAVEQRLKDAKALRAQAMAEPGERDLVAAVARLRSYVDTFGTDDAAARQRLAELSSRVEQKESRARRVAAMKQAAQEGKWLDARRLAMELLREDADDVDAQRVRDHAETELNRQGVEGALRALDDALVRGSFDDALRLLDPEAPTYAVERAALADLTQVRGRFTSSAHDQLTISVEGDHAVVTGTWTFTIEALDQAPQSIIAQHRIRMRRVGGGRWLLCEFQVEGEPRVNRR